MKVLLALCVILSVFGSSLATDQIYTWLFGVGTNSSVVAGAVGYLVQGTHKLYIYGWTNLPNVRSIDLSLTNSTGNFGDFVIAADGRFNNRVDRNGFLTPIEVNRAATIALNEWRVTLSITSGTTTISTNNADGICDHLLFLNSGNSVPAQTNAFQGFGIVRVLNNNAIGGDFVTQWRQQNANVSSSVTLSGLVWFPSATPATNLLLARGNWSLSSPQPSVLPNISLSTALRNGVNSTWAGIPFTATGLFQFNLLKRDALGTNAYVSLTNSAGVDVIRSQLLPTSHFSFNNFVDARQVRRERGQVVGDLRALRFREITSRGIVASANQVFFISPNVTRNATVNGVSASFRFQIPQNPRQPAVRPPGVPAGSLSKVWPAEVNVNGLRLFLNVLTPNAFNNASDIVYTFTLLSKDRDIPNLTLGTFSSYRGILPRGNRYFKAWFDLPDLGRQKRGYLSNNRVATIRISTPTTSAVTATAGSPLFIDQLALVFAITRQNTVAELRAAVAVPPYGQFLPI